MFLFFYFRTDLYIASGKRRAQTACKIQRVLAVTVQADGFRHYVRPFAGDTAHPAVLHHFQSLRQRLFFAFDQRASLGAVQSRFDNTISNLQTSVENQTAARGRIMDADFASESAALSRAQILSQASTAMIAQANQVPQGVMKLLN